MTISPKIIKFLQENKIKYEIINHKTVFTAYDKAATLKIKPNIVGKSLVLKTDKDLIVVLVPGNKNLDLAKIKKSVNDWIRLCNKVLVKQGKKQQLKPVVKVDFISETIIKNKFKGIKIGTLPPFGGLWKLPTFVDRGLLKEKNIIVNSGSYEVSFKLNPKIFEKLENNVLGVFSKPKK